jgi:hypothetical protein
VVSFKNPADTPAMPGMLRKSTAFVPRYQKFESISLQERVCKLSVPRAPSSRRRFEPVHLKMLYVAASAKAAIKHLSLWLPGRGRMGSGSAGLRSGLTVCSRQAVRPIIRPWMRRSTRFFREPRARRWHQRPHRMSDEEHRAGTVRVSAEGLACTKAVCNYIYDTYGRFPGAIDAMHLMWMMQAHHIDTDYYNRFFGRGAYGSTHAAHLATWHR